MGKDVTATNAGRNIAIQGKGNSMESAPIDFACSSPRSLLSIRSIALHFSIIALVWMAISNSVYASGDIFPQPWVWVSSNQSSIIYADQNQACLGEAQFISAYWSWPFESVNSCLTFPPPSRPDVLLVAFSAANSSRGPYEAARARVTCPAHSSPSASSNITCTCNPNFKPDPTATSCVPVTECPITGLTTDPADPNGLDALSKQYDKTEAEKKLTKDLEAGMNAYSLLSGKTQAAEQCLAGRIGSAFPQSDSGYKVTSAVRTIAYQAHLRKLWDKFFELQRAIKKKPAIKQMCPALIAQVEGEIGFRLDQNPARKNEPCTAPGRNHCIRSIPADPNKDPKHTDKLAFDISETAVRKYQNILLPPRTMATEASACNLTWGGTFTPIDVVHFLCCVK